jgi:hypothetical protein
MPPSKLLGSVASHTAPEDAIAIDRKPRLAAGFAPAARRDHWRQWQAPEAGVSSGVCWRTWDPPERADSDTAPAMELLSKGLFSELRSCRRPGEADRFRSLRKEA